MQLLYTKKFNAENVKITDEDWLYESYNNFYNLYLFLLSLFIKIKLKTENYLKINEKKYLPSNNNIYKKFSKNRIFDKIENHIRLLNFNFSNIQLDWNNYKDYLSIIWNDKDLNIKWGIKKPILSTKDNKAQKITQFIKNFNEKKR